jgi:hypothetical protein
MQACAHCSWKLLDTATMGIVVDERKFVEKDAKPSLPTTRFVELSGTARR